VLLISLFALLLTFSRSQGFIWLNQIHSALLTFIFEKITFMGDGWFIISLSIGLLFLKKYQKLAFIILLSYISSGLFSQLLKACVSSPRPFTYFELHHYKYYVETFANSRVGFKSFPSGHTASFFALATVMGNHFKNKYVCSKLLIMSALVGYSRIYLGHHFLIDVTFGAIIGLAFGFWSTVWISQLSANPLVRKKIKKLKRRARTSNTIPIHLLEE
jgi:undecaprenyl-diphosphatase